MTTGLAIGVVITSLALVFAFINGFYDSTHPIGSLLSSALPMRTAILIAAVLNFAGAMAGTAVATTIAKGFTSPSRITEGVVLAALVGATLWTLITRRFAIPSSSSHALIGGLAGAVVAHAGFAAFEWRALVSLVLVPLVVSPTVCFLGAFVVMVLLMWVFRRARPSTVTRTSRRLQLLSAMAMAFGHGSNDAQKSMGIIALALAARLAGGGRLPDWMPASGAGGIPLWVIVSCAAAIAAGTAVGGARIIKTIGTRIIRITPLQGFAAGASGAITILVASGLGVPVSTTHCVNASIMGVGASQRISAVRWGVAGNILAAWVLTLPLSGALAFVTMKILATWL